MKVGFLMGFACTAVLHAATVDHAGWFTFQVPWDDTTRNATNLAWGVEAPAGMRGFVKVGSDGHFRYQDGSRARFAGFVSVAQANLPDSADAPAIAAHLRRFGVNFLRLHLTDVDGAPGLFANTSVNTTDLSAAKMRRLDWFQKCLKANGIYVNFCVQSGRIFRPGDGIPAKITNYQSKLVSLFDPVLIRLQQRLARDLATHVNPFTGLAYKDDPAVATWELSNENQLFMGWLSWGSPGWDSLTAANPQGMNGYYHRELDSLWNAWLKARHGNDSTLNSAWGGSGTESANLVGNPSFENGTAGWGWWADPASGAGITVKNSAGGLSGSRALSVRVDSQGTDVYSSSVNFGGMSVSKGRSYRLRFAVKGSQTSSLAAEFLKESVWTWYGSSTCATDTGWRFCESYLTAPADITDSLRFNLDFGHSSGTFLIDSVQFSQYAGDALRPGESLATNSVRRSSRSSVGSLTDERVRDEARFYHALEGRYIDAVKGFLSDSLGVKVPVTFTNNWYGPASIASQSRADYMDAHWYWQHPDFPNGWSATDYTIGNTPMVKDPDGGTVVQFSGSRVAGKPFVGSEYNHPFPSQYLCEAPSFYFGYLGFLDADGALLHAYIDYTLHYKDAWNDQFFNVGTNPVLMTQLPLAHLFRAGRIAAAASQVTVDMSERDWTLSSKTVKDGFPFEGSKSALLRTPMRWGRFDADSSTVPVLSDPGSAVQSNSGELLWDRSAGVLRIDNPFWQGAVGFLKQGATGSRLRISSIATTGGRDFAAVHLVSVDSQAIGTSRKMLLLTSARVENRSTEWNGAFNALTVVAGAGDTTVCEPVTGTVTFDLGRRDSVSVYALDARGDRIGTLPLTHPDDSARTLSLSLPGSTLWYEVAVGDATSPVSSGVRGTRSGAAGLRLLRNGTRAGIGWDAPEPGRIEIGVLDVHGRRIRMFERAIAAGSGEMDIPVKGFALLEVRLIAAGKTTSRTIPVAGF